MAKFKKGLALDPNEIVNYQEDGIVSMELLHDNNGSITVFAFSKGQQLSPHSAPMDALIQVTDGSMTMLLNGTEHTIKAGEIFMIPAGEIHSVRADSDFKMIITLIK